MTRITIGANNTGCAVRINRKNLHVRYPKTIWKSCPPWMRQLLAENLGFGFTHFLGPVLKDDALEYNIPCPFLESLLFRNQLGDLLVCEKADEAPHLSYLKQFYNQELRFAPGECALPGEFPTPTGEKAVLPFTFGKESLATLGLCRELGIEPILMYSEEPSQPYEGAFKKKLLKRFEQLFGLKSYFVDNSLGLVRYSKAFPGVPPSELGWGSQTTLLCLMALPVLWQHRARYVFIGSEFSNNEFLDRDGWKVFLSYDQTSFWTKQQRLMMRSLTSGNSSVYASLEPIEEIAIFSMLHHRYPELGRFQFSCSAEAPLGSKSQWCQRCYKCDRMYLFARACGVDPASIGFTVDLLSAPGGFNNYFGKEFKTGSASELDFAFYVLHRKGDQSRYTKRFRREKLGSLRPWSFYRGLFTKIHPAQNLPPRYEARMTAIFREELERFSDLLP